MLDGGLRQPREGVPPLRTLELPERIGGFPHTFISFRSTLPKQPSLG
nr:hypothetical protein OG999_35385 [Streptomyces sp. NBC_00886]